MNRGGDFPRDSSDGGVVKCIACQRQLFYPDFWSSLPCDDCGQPVAEVNALVAQLRKVVSRKDTRRKGLVPAEYVPREDGMVLGGDPVLRTMTLEEMREALTWQGQGK